MKFPHTKLRTDTAWKSTGQGKLPFFPTTWRVRDPGHTLRKPRWWVAHAASPAAGPAMHRSHASAPPRRYHIVQASVHSLN